MNAKELRAMDEAALKKELADLMQAHFKLRMQHGTQQLQNPNQLRTTRRDIARVRTILAQKAARNDTRNSKDYVNTYVGRQSCQQ